MALLVEWLLPTPEVRGSNESHQLKFTINCIEKMKIKKKRPGMAHFKRTSSAKYYLRFPRCIFLTNFAQWRALHKVRQV